jgi:hypothetical protein
VIARAIPEAELQAGIIELAEYLGYTVCHVRDSRRQKVTGLPDLIIAREAPPKFLWVELKREMGPGRRAQLTPRQEVWKRLCEANNQPWYLWRPSDWLDGTIERILDATQ